MVAGLLFLIVLILLFGAGVVKGWLLNVAGAVLGFVIVIGTILWICSEFSLGDDGFMAIWIGFLMSLAGLGAWGRSYLARAATKAATPKSANPLSRTLYVWRIYEPDINRRFSPEAKAAAFAALNRSDEHGLNSLCMEELARLGGERG